MTPNIQIARKTPLLPQEMKTKKRAKSKPPRINVDDHNNKENDKVQINDPNSMDSEVEAGVSLILRFVQNSQSRNNNNNHNSLQEFRERLIKEITCEYTGHWYPEKPLKGSAFRCLRINQNGSDSLIEKTAKMCNAEWVVNSLPREFTIWIDPTEVSYRIGEEGSICVHFAKKLNTKICNSTYSYA